jgi:hypothetical protein
MVGDPPDDSDGRRDGSTGGDATIVIVGVVAGIFALSLFAALVGGQRIQSHRGGQRVHCRQTHRVRRRCVHRLARCSSSGNVLAIGSWDGARAYRFAISLFTRVVRILPS